VACVAVVAGQEAVGREVGREGAAEPDFAFDRQPRLVEVEHVLDDGEPEPGAAAFARTAGGDAVEAFGDAWQVRGGNAEAAVGDREDRAVV